MTTPRAWEVPHLRPGDMLPTADDFPEYMADADAFPCPASAGSRSGHCALGEDHPGTVHAAVSYSGRIVSVWTQALPTRYY